MTEPTRIDPERIAALIDGKLSDADAAALRAELASSDDDALGAYADAIAISPDVAAQLRVQRVGGRSLASWRSATALAAAAAIVVAVTIQRSVASRSDYQPQTLAVAIEQGAVTLGSPVWSATRGEAATFSRRTISARTGALLVDLEIASARNDSATAKSRALEIVSLLSGVAGGVVASSRLNDYAMTLGALTVSERRSAGQQLIRLLDDVFAKAGSYLEAARIATASGDTSFFTRHPPKPVARLESDTIVDAPIRAAAHALSALTAAHSRDASSLNAAASELLRLITL